MDNNDKVYTAEDEEEDDEYDDFVLNEFDDDDDEDNDATETIFPCLDPWRLTEDGAIAGLVSNHPLWGNGEPIVTSPLASSGNDDETSETSYAVSCQDIVTTVTGSQYLLGSHQMIVHLEDWKITSEGFLQGTPAAAAVVCLSHEQDECDLDVDERVQQQYWDLLVQDQQQQQLLHSANEKDDDQEELLVMCQEITASSKIVAPANPQEWLEPNTIVTTAMGTQYRLGDMYVYPLLESWKRLEGGSIAGIVSRHSVIPEGSMITTSPLVELDEYTHPAGLVIVTTESGSQYELGRSEQDVLESEHQGSSSSSEARYEDERTVIMEVEVQQHEQHDYACEIIPTNHIPKPPGPPHLPPPPPLMDGMLQGTAMGWNRTALGTSS